MSANPIKSLTICPAYGQFSATLRWVGDAPEGSLVWAYRSYNEVDWQLVTPEPTQASRGMLVDTDLLSPDNDTWPAYYLVLTQPDGQQFESEISRPFSSFSRKEYGIARRMINLELRSMRDGRQGRQVWVYRYPCGGKPCHNCADSETGQRHGSTQCQLCHGTGLEGGYAPPILTWASKLEVGKDASQESTQDAGTVNARDAVFRMLPWPIIAPGDMLVEPKTDRRWIVKPGVEWAYFMSEIPIVANFGAETLKRGDIRYTIQTPALS